ncbi:LOW QUALITY PROTEIN: trans-1,2-dihydrobenzene-1,2-diol dehydrogenase [Drosophila eugracilis]|uniref:LOW QUALITY PROTEIN: trans-1,2-dihydrobenzene-1,2-diol dehydrogenase n=1 Tax=Drosophila eugracilis TaxID=29029 RepID=UPI001BDAC3E3|nr:LOW QUALITY PROTEIN: trans-1,2-dihydrobenzene-1,2-diol dehydrogenase [Drosophila eugracilis]
MFKIISYFKSRPKKFGVRCYQNRLPTCSPSKADARRSSFGFVGGDIGDQNMWQSRPRQLHVNPFTFPTTHSKAEPATHGKGEWVADEGPTLRWGIAPVSLMADDFAAALSVLPEKHHRIVSCVAAYQSHALAFSDRHKVDNVYTSFEDLAKCPNVDVVYISPLNPQHSELCHLMLNHDKHVLCEKPLCMTEDQVTKLLEKARARGLFLMEGMWPRCVPAYHYLRHQILRNRLGELQTVHCSLGLPVSQGRLGLYGGVTNDFGVYGMQLALWVFREIPRCLKVSGRVNSQNVDVAADIELCFTRGKKAFIEVSSEKKLDNLAIVKGTNGSIKMNNYWCPTRLITDEVDYEFPLPGSDEMPPTHYHNRLGMCYEAEEVRNCIMKGSYESDDFSHNESLLLANLMDTIHAELGVGEFANRTKVPDLQRHIENVQDIVEDPEELASETCRVVQDVSSSEALQGNQQEEEAQSRSKAIDAP